MAARKDLKTGWTIKSSSERAGCQSLLRSVNLSSSSSSSSSCCNSLWDPTHNLHIPHPPILIRSTKTQLRHANLAVTSNCTLVHARHFNSSTIPLRRTAPAPSPLSLESNVVAIVRAEIWQITVGFRHIASLQPHQQKQCNQDQKKASDTHNSPNPPNSCNLYKTPSTHHKSSN